MGHIFAKVRICLEIYHSVVSNTLFSSKTSMHVVEDTFNDGNEWDFNRPACMAWSKLTN